MLNFRLNYSKGGLGWFTAYNVFLNKLQGPILPRLSRDRTNFEMVIIYGGQGSARWHLYQSSQRNQDFCFILVSNYRDIFNALIGISYAAYAFRCSCYPFTFDTTFWITLLNCTFGQFSNCSNVHNWFRLEQKCFLTCDYHSHDIDDIIYYITVLYVWEIPCFRTHRKCRKLVRLSFIFLESISLNQFAKVILQKR